MIKRFIMLFVGPELQKLRAEIAEQAALVKRLEHTIGVLQSTKDRELWWAGQYFKKPVEERS